MGLSTGVDEADENARIRDPKWEMEFVIYYVIANRG